MSPWKSRNPFAFTPSPVAIITSFVYVGLIAALLVVHHVVPSAPSNPTPAKGVNLTEAWGDLQELSNGFHPYNSRRNDEVRNWLLRKIEAILRRNKMDFSTETGLQPPKQGYRSWNETSSSPVVVFNDMVSNLTFSSSGNLSIYFEGTNIMVYIRGTEDVAEDWWKTSRHMRTSKAYTGKGGVLVNAHYDSVSTGYGATDDGIGVITVLQLISHFTSAGNKPKRGVVALLNNGEEDYLNGAWAFMRHPISQFPKTFLNLEGAGAGGRATLFRSTDAEVTMAYKKSSRPFGTVISGDGFNQGLIRSQTDYVVFNGELGLRGLDVAFMEPRQRYHTTQDSARYASIDSLWHMLSSSLATVKALSSSPVEDNADAHQGTDAVWFDLFGRAFAVFRLHTLFALSVTLLVVSPIILIALTVILIELDKWYLFARRKHVHSSDDEEAVPLNGWRGFFRSPIVFIAASAALIGLGFLITKVNPYIVYSSEYAVWSMMLTAWLAIAWFLLKGGDFMRPSALYRTYALIWTYIGAYILLVGTTVMENNYQIAGGYAMVIYFAAIFAALLLSYLELFFLPKKSIYVQQAAQADNYGGSYSPTTRSITSSRLLPASADENHANAHVTGGDADDEATETTLLLHGDRQTTFARYGARHQSGEEGTEAGDSEQHLQKHLPYGEEQAWSGYLPRWIWLLQFLLVAPIVIILIGQISLLVTSALHQTPADGSPVLTVYMFIAALSILILMPMLPFLHRFTFHIPTLLFLIFAGTLIYNLIAFPFSPNNRLKVYFVQQVDLDTGINSVSLTGLDPYVRDIVAQIPSAAGQNIDCTVPDLAAKKGLLKCAWNGLPPQVVPAPPGAVPPGVPPEKGYADWMSFNVSRTSSANEAVFTLAGRNTRACRLLFASPVSDIHVSGAAEDRRFRPVGEDGTTELRLWSREWEKPWKVSVKWAGDEVRGLDGKAVCLWTDANESGVIPALDEIRMFMPTWAAVSKLGDGLVEGSKAFVV